MGLQNLPKRSFVKKAWDELSTDLETPEAMPSGVQGTLKPQTPKDLEHKKPEPYMLEVLFEPLCKSLPYQQKRGIFRDWFTSLDHIKSLQE